MITPTLVGGVTNLLHLECLDRKLRKRPKPLFPGLKTDATDEKKNTKYDTVDSTDGASDNYIYLKPNTKIKVPKSNYLKLDVDYMENLFKNPFGNIPHF